jgi:putative ABC transport system ATP-binding protein
MIKLDNLSRQFGRGQTDVHALRGVDLTVEAGEFVALVGPSGSGKSTLLNLLGGLDRPSGGQLWFNELALHTAGEKERTAHRRERIGFVFQSFNLLPRLTAQENVAMPLMLAGVPAAERNERAQATLTKVGLAHRLDHYPAELSGGEQQRVAIARAVAKQPDILLCDEPTGALDFRTGIRVLEVLESINREMGTTVAIITHNEVIGEMADRVIRLRDGRVDEILVNATRRPARELRW